MSLNVTTSKLTSTPSASGWVQVHEFSPQEEDKLKVRGKIFAVIATKKPKEGVEAVSLGREIITRLHEEYYANLEGTSLFVLQNAIKKIKEEFREFDLEIGVIVYVEDDLFVVGCGGVIAQVLRGKSLVTLLETEKEPISVSGKPTMGDIFILGTKAFFSDFSYTEVKLSFLENGVSSSVEEFATKIHASPNLGSAGFLALKFGEVEKVNIEKISSEEPLKEVLPTTPKESQLKKFLSKLPKRPIKLKDQNLNQATPQGRKTTFSVGLILLVLLVVSVLFGLNQKKKNDLQKVYGTKLESALKDYNQSLDVLSLDKTKARELFLSAKEKLDEVKASDYKDERIIKLADDINSKQGEILGEYSVETNDFLDLTLQTSGFSGFDLSSSGQELFVLDKDNRQIIKVAIDTKKASLVSGSDDVEDALQVGSYEDRLFVLRKNGIYELTEGEEKVVDSEDWDNVLFYFYSANLYVLEKNTNMVFRYPGTTDGFGDKSDWLAPGIEADFSKVTDMSIDGSIWLLSSSGKVSRFTLGSPQAVSLEGLPEQLIEPTAIYTNEELENVYVLDAKQGRVVVLEKSGEFKVQYIAEEIKNAKDLVVSESEGKIILLTVPKLVSIELKN